MFVSAFALFSFVQSPISADPIKPRTRFGNELAITPERLRAHLEFIASDELEGRDTPSKGLDVATLYVATMLKIWGAQPAGDDGTFFQKIPLSRPMVDTEKTTVELSGKTLSFGDGIHGANLPTTASGKLVYAGHGYIFKKKGIDPYSGLDVKGKIVVVASGLPKGTGFEDMQGTAGEDFAWPALAAKKRGAVAILTIPDKTALANWNATQGASMGGLAPDAGEFSSDEIANVTAGPGLISALFDGEKMSAEDAMKGREAPEAGMALGDAKSMRLNVIVIKNTRYTRNVVAIIPGTDSKLKDEYVAFGAHIDHVGMYPGTGGDRIFNGADDDGSGTVALLEIAHAFLTEKRPKRSCLFVWHCGEEKGMWGSTYFTNHPAVDIKQIVTQLNIDMIGRSKPAGDTKPANRVLSGPEEIYVVGSTKMSSDLQKTSEQVNQNFLRLSFNYKYDDPKDPEGIFTRSDHYMYARKGIPIIFYFDGVHEDYHQVSDEVSKIDFDKMTNVTRTVYATGLTLANAKKRPVVDKPLTN